MPPLPATGSPPINPNVEPHGPTGGRPRHDDVILGSKGVAQTAAAGALLTATGAVGALMFASWALLDRLRTRGQPSPRPEDSRLRS